MANLGLVDVDTDNEDVKKCLMRFSPIRGG